MAIPEKTINDIIIKAFYLVNEYSPEEMPTAYEISEGLDYLNELLDNLSANNVYIPYNNDVVFNTVAHQAKYSLSKQPSADVDTNKIVEITDAWINYQGLVYPLTKIQHDEAFQITRYPNAYTRPSQIFFNNSDYESFVTFFYTPDIVYEVHLRVKQVLDHFDLNQEITTLPPYYQRFLRYALARELASVFETDTWSEIKEKEYQRMYSDLQSASDTDWSLNISGVLKRRYIGWTKAVIIVG